MSRKVEFNLFEMLSVRCQERGNATKVTPICMPPASFPPRLLKLASSVKMIDRGC